MREKRKVLSQRVRYGDVDPHDVEALQNISALRAGYLPWTGSALRPSTCQQVLNDVLLNNRKVIVEFGAGISTVLLSALDAHFELGIEIYSVDESEEWLRRIEQDVRRVAPTVRFTPLYSPLEPLHDDDAEWSATVSRWYGMAVLSRLPVNVDLMLCDGPTAYLAETRYDRWPALPLVHDLLSERCAVLLDDTSRAGERFVASNWSARFPDFTQRPGATWTWFTRGQYWNT